MHQLRRCRKISPFEWLYLSATRGFPPCAVQLRIASDTLPSRTALEAALARAAEANPGVRWIPKGAWWVDSGKPPRLRHMARSEVASLDHTVFRESFTFDDIPPVEILWWEGAGLVFRCSHALMDAGGLIFFAEETFRALRGDALLGSNHQQSTREHLLKFNHPERRPWFKPDKISPLGPPSKGKSGFVWETRTVPGKVSAVGARVASSWSHLAARLRPNDTTRLMTPVNLRQVDSTLRSTGNLSNAFFFDAPATASWRDFYGWTLDAFARHDERMTSGVDRVFPWVPLPVLNGFHRWAHERQVRTDRYLFSGTLSHIDHVSLQAFSAEGFVPDSASLLPFDAPGSAVTIITLQHDHGVEIAASCPAATGSDGRLAQALDRLCADLEAGRYSASGTPRMTVDPVPEDGPSMDLPGDVTVHGLFADQVERTPEQAAISDSARSFSYAELDRLVHRYAEELHGRGVLPGANVAIMADRSVETIAGMLAILRAGAAFVPIDTEWPQERIRFVLNDCRPACVMVEDRYAMWAESFPRIHFSELQCAGPDSFVAAPHLSSPTSPAYVLYTSGSTGRPKGVVVEQRSLLNYVLWAKSAYLTGMSTPVVFPFFTSLSFDLTLTAIFVPLVTGGEIRVFPQGDPLVAIHAVLKDPTINAVKLTPSHLRLFAEAGVKGCGIRKYIASGEALPTHPAKEITEQSAGVAEIFNEYGPTEATVGCVVHRYQAECDLAPFVPIGRPIANTEVLLLDEHLQPVPNGQVGEVYLSGACLARGYLARPEEDKRFQTHPFRKGERMYRTGDRAVRLPNGNFDYLGRLDGQVKVRGHRVETGEIEAAIEASGCCRSCAVMPEHSESGTRLTAFVVWREDRGEDELRAALARRLPVYMMPSRVVALDEMPLNVNGKIDKSRLPMDRSSPAGEGVDDPIADDMEGVLAAMVVDLSGGRRPSLPPDRSLLEIGLDSLQMMLLFTRAANQFLPAASRNSLFSDAREFLLEPTVQNLAAHLRRLSGASGDTSGPALRS